MRTKLLRSGLGFFAFAAGISLVNVLLFPYARENYGYGLIGLWLAYAAALALLLLKRRPSSTLFSLPSATLRWLLSRLLRTFWVWVLRRLRSSLRLLLRLLRKAFPRLRLRRSRLSLKRLALRSSSSNSCYLRSLYTYTPVRRIGGFVF